MVRQITKEDIELAKKYLEGKTGYYNREWEIKIWREGESDAQFEIHIMNGTPAKGYVIVNFGNYTISVYDGTDTRIKRWRFNV
jgi:hypothetical protein